MRYNSVSSSTIRGGKYLQIFLEKSYDHFKMGVTWLALKPWLLSFKTALIIVTCKFVNWFCDAGC